MRVLSHFVLVAALAAWPALAQAAQVTGDPDRIAALMDELGMPTTRGQDIEGLPMLESQTDGLRFNVYFYDCAALCDNMQFVTGFVMPEPMSAEAANAWNRDNPFSTVIVADDGTAFLAMHIGLAGDGVGRKNFQRTLQNWRTALKEFRDYIGW